jgi:hypothetical protein
MAHALNLHQEIHFDILELINCELMSRPTYKQAMEKFRQCVPTVMEARILEKEGKLVKAVPNLDAGVPA